MIGLTWNQSLERIKKQCELVEKWGLGAIMGDCQRGGAYHLTWIWFKLDPTADQLLLCDSC